MYSMNYIGKFIANFREFYNDINGATLTGAIDVVVVEQPDGSFTCSPFHVRFGKLGVLRSRFKVVDLELNGEPLNIHMKLGESGEAFFVEEMGENDADCLAHLATSPIPAGHFEEMYEPRRRNSLSAVEPDHGQASDYTKRRYTADGQSMQKPDFSRLRKKDSNKTEKKPNDMVEQDALFEMDGIDGLDETQSDWPESTLPKTFSATQLGEPECEANQAVLKISEQNDFRTIEAAESLEDVKQTGNGKKKKKRKVSSKKKHHRKSSTSSISSQSDRAGSEHRSSQPTAEVSFFSDSEANVVISEEMSNMKLNGDKRIPLALSDTAFEVQAATRNAGSRSATPVQSDTEVELSHGTAGDKSSQSWRWGELPEPPPTSPLSDDKRSSRRPLLRGMFNFMSKEVDTAGGVYLDDLDRGQVDPDLYFPKHNADKYRSDPTPTTIERAGPTEEEYESGNGPSLPQSPASPVCLEPPTIDSDDEKMLAKGQVAIFIREEGSSGTISRAIDYEEFCSRGGELLSEGKLLVRLGDRYLPWKSAGPLLLSILAFRRPLPTRMIESLEKGMESNTSRTSEVGSKSRGYSWWSWRRTNSEAKREEILATQPKTETTQETTEDSIVDVVNVTDISVEQKDAESGEKKETESEEAETKVNLEEIQAAVNEIVANEQLLEENVQLAQEEVREDSTESENDDNGHDRPTRRHSTFKKTLRLSSDQIKKLRLREGMNEMVFSVTTAYQGTTKCKCNVFRWRYDDKIVISDIDGTITKSDVLGHIFPLVGKDWAQSGVAQLFTKIKNNGYQLLYLSARAIGQARVTREYLRSIKQGEVCLPDGPLLLNPTSLLRAFHREVIEKKPEEFKIQCLADIKALFPQGSNPFYAGYGNRVNDVCAYEAVGIPIVRIFTINYKGELKHELTQTFQSTYSHMSVMVDQVFPPSLCEPTDEFSQTIYWKEPIPNIEINSLTPLQP